MTREEYEEYVRMLADGTLNKRSNTTMLNTQYQKALKSNPSGNCLEARWKKAAACAGGECLETRWKKAAASTSSNCAEARTNGDTIEVRDSKDPDGPVLQYTIAEWDAFLDGAKKGEFDLPPELAATLA